MLLQVQISLFFYVLYPFVTYLLTLVRTGVERYGCTNLFGTTFRKLDLFPSSGDGGKTLLCWVP
jgi:hypothetical protein